LARVGGTGVTTGPGHFPPAPTTGAPTMAQQSFHHPTGTIITKNANGRPTGTHAVLVPEAALSAAIAKHNGWEASEVRPEQTWLIARGEGDSPRYAITNTEGVTHMPSEGPFEVYDSWRTALYPIPVEALVEAARGGETWDLADVVRVYGHRLEINFSIT